MSETRWARRWELLWELQLEMELACQASTLVSPIPTVQMWGKLHTWVQESESRADRAMATEMAEWKARLWGRVLACLANTLATRLVP